MSRAMYGVCSDPVRRKSPQVVASLEEGIKGITVLHAKTPKDCYAFLRDNDNRDIFHGGSSTNFKQVLDEVPTHEANFAAFAFEKGLTARTPKLSMVVLSWLQKHADGYYGSTNEFESAKIVSHYLKLWECSEPFREFLGASANFRQGPLKATIFYNLHNLMTTLDKFRLAWDTPFVTMAFFEASNFSLQPDRRGDSARPATCTLRRLWGAFSRQRRPPSRNPLRI